jgi:hypothetical protein
MLKMVLGLVVFMLVAGCDSSAPTVPTAVPSNPTVSATATSEATATVEQASPTPRTAVATATSTGRDTGVSGDGGWSPNIRWRGGDWFLLGVNYPYYHYGNDFGGNAWGNYGVHDPSSYAAVDSDFARMSSMGMRTARWFVFADGRAGITFDDKGMPTGVDEFVVKDLDAALEIAQKHNIGLDLVLIDYQFMWDAKTENGVQLGGHSAVLASAEGQQALVDKVFKPILERYADNQSIISWEVMNEPEWTIQDAGTVDHTKISEPITLAKFRAFAQMTVDAIHDIAHSYATIGGADMKWAQNWMGLGLDYYQIHFYDWMQPYSTDNLFNVRAESLRLDRPVVVGEFPADHSTVAGLRDYLNIWYMNGYAGAWSWSLHNDTTWGSPDADIMKSWSDAHKATVEITAAP